MQTVTDVYVDNECQWCQHLQCLSWNGQFCDVDELWV